MALLFSLHYYLFAKSSADEAAALKKKREALVASEIERNHPYISEKAIEKFWWLAIILVIGMGYVNATINANKTITENMADGENWIVGGIDNTTCTSFVTRRRADDGTTNNAWYNVTYCLYRAGVRTEENKDTIFDGEALCDSVGMKRGKVFGHTEVEALKEFQKKDGVKAAKVYYLGAELSTKSGEWFWMDRASIAPYNQPNSTDTLERYLRVNGFQNIRYETNDDGVREKIRYAINVEVDNKNSKPRNWHTQALGVAKAEWKDDYKYEWEIMRECGPWMDNPNGEMSDEPQFAYVSENPGSVLEQDAAESRMFAPAHRGHRVKRENMYDRQVAQMADECDKAAPSAKEKSLAVALLIEGMSSKPYRDSDHFYKYQWRCNQLCEKQELTTVE